jgi:hypothetical protein
MWRVRAIEAVEATRNCLCAISVQGSAVSVESLGLVKCSISMLAGLNMMRRMIYTGQSVKLTLGN